MFTIKVDMILQVHYAELSESKAIKSVDRLAANI
jgi:hypothetical protein